jgi:hypothetical protein
VGQKWQCPAHGAEGEHSPSLHLADGQRGQLLIKCHAGCDYREVLWALSVGPGALTEAPPTPPERHAAFFLRHLKFPLVKRAEPVTAGGSSERRSREVTGFRREARHPYARRGDVRRAVAWKLRYRHPETGAKAVRWASRGEDGRLCRGLGGLREVDLALYCEHTISPSRRVILCESESSVDALRAAGVCATTWPGGASSPPLDYLAQVLGGHPDVLIVPDNDDAGRAAGDQLAATLPRARTLLGGPGDDARDLLNRLGPGVFEADFGTADARSEDLPPAPEPRGSDGSDPDQPPEPDRPDLVKPEPEPEAWVPSTAGEGIQGVVLDVGETTFFGETTFDFFEEEEREVFPVVTIKTRDGRRLRIAGFGMLLKREILNANPKPGDLFACKYLGIKKIEKGKFAGKPYMHFVVRVRRRPLPGAAS